MKIYNIENVGPEKSGRMNATQVASYKYNDLKLQQEYVTHGSILAHAYSHLVDQVSPTRDSLVGRINGRHLNVTFIRAMCFCGYLHHKYSNQYSTLLKTGANYLPPGYKLQELYQGIIYLYNKQSITNLVNMGNGEFMRLAKDSKTHVNVYTNPNEFLGEYYIFNRLYLPEPDYIIIGSIAEKINANQRVDLYNDIFPKIKVKHPKTDIILFPNASLLKNKELGQTGNTLSSKAGTKILQRLFTIKSGKLGPTMEI